MRLLGLRWRRRPKMILVCGARVTRSCCWWGHAQRISNMLHPIDPRDSSSSFQRDARITFKRVTDDARRFVKAFHPCAFFGLFRCHIFHFFSFLFLKTFWDGTESFVVIMGIKQTARHGRIRVTFFVIYKGIPPIQPSETNLYRSFISLFFSFILRANKWLAHVCITFLNSSFIGIPAEMLCDVYTFLTQMFFFFPAFPF